MLSAFLDNCIYIDSICVLSLNIPRSLVRTHDRRDNLGRTFEAEMYYLFVIFSQIRTLQRVVLFWPSGLADTYDYDRILEEVERRFNPAWPSRTENCKFFGAGALESTRSEAEHRIRLPHLGLVPSLTFTSTRTITSC